MCDFDGRLIAWLDHELPEEEAADVDRHVAACTQCRKRADAYGRVSVAFAAYCDALSSVQAHDRMPGWKLTVLGVGAVAAVLAFAIPVHHPRKEAIETPPPISTPDTNATPTAIASALTAAARPTAINSIKRNSAKTVRPRTVVAPIERQDLHLLSTEPAVQIAIPADALLPPGAAPQGAIFLLDLEIAPDGSAHRVRLTPQLTGFERRAILP
jgi:anti-sigma factor RsiW